ncbi:MAG: outer membrane protein transport protein [Candidatus Hydrogenedentes bacterium]|nr:outer membrane protein transport protein [Candidatus Hydrogenedentota bacterium]
MSSPSKRACRALFILWAAASTLVHAQELEFSVSPSPVGSGARAAGMGDAFVAVADDATAASWNPAGLVQLERPEVSVVGSYNGIIEEFGASWHDEIDSWHREKSIDVNFLSITYPLPVLVLGRNMSVGLYYQQKYDFSRQFKLKYNSGQTRNDGNVLSQYDRTEFTQDGSLSTITPAFAIELTKRLSLGVAANFWRSTPISDNSWTQTIEGRSLAQQGANLFYTQFSKEEEYSDFSGENATFGLLWNVTDKWNVGARFDCAFTGEADYSITSSRSIMSFTPGASGMPLQLAPFTNKEKRDVHFPATLAAGVSYRANDRLTLSFDITSTDWSDFYFRGGSNNRISLVNGGNLEAVWFAPRFERTYTVRFGTEYVFIPRQPEEKLDRLWTLRAGLFYDQEPATHEPDNFWGATIGLGLLAKGRVNIDLAYQLRYGHDVNADFVRGIEGFNEDAFQNRFLISTVIYF